MLFAAKWLSGKGIGGITTMTQHPATGIAPQRRLPLGHETSSAEKRTHNNNSTRSTRLQLQLEKSLICAKI